MNRADLQRLCEMRVQEAEALRVAGLQEGAYYLLGYAVECALKACIAKQIREHDFPDKKLVTGAHTHDVTQLFAISGLKAEFEADLARNNALQLNWNIVKDWNEASRYLPDVPRPTVDQFFLGVLHDQDGVLIWLKNRW